MSKSQTRFQSWLSSLFSEFDLTQVRVSSRSLFVSWPVRHQCLMTLSFRMLNGEGGVFPERICLMRFWIYNLIFSASSGHAVWNSLASKRLLTLLLLPKLEASNFCGAEFYLGIDPKIIYNPKFHLSHHFMRSLGNSQEINQLASTCISTARWIHIQSCNNVFPPKSQYNCSWCMYLGENAPHACKFITAL